MDLDEQTIISIEYPNLIRYHHYRIFARINDLDMRSRVSREIQYLRLLSHPHIVKLYVRSQLGIISVDFQVNCLLQL